jgi:hypothetical protein
MPACTAYLIVIATEMARKAINKEMTTFVQGQMQKNRKRKSSG